MTALVVCESMWGNTEQDSAKRTSLLRIGAAEGSA